MNRELHLLIPETIDIDNLLNEDYYFRPDRRFKPESALYIIHLLQSFDMLHDEGEMPLEVLERGHALNSDLLQKVISSYYNVYLDYLIENNIIETDGSYSSSGHKSKHYKLTDGYRFQKVIKHRILDKTIKRKLLEHYNSLKAAKDYPQLFRTFKNISVNHEEAIDMISEIAVKNSKDEDGKYINKFSALLDQFLDGQYYFHRGNKGGRLFHNLNGLKSEIRSLYRYNGKKLITLDVKCCIPYIMIKFITNEHLRKELLLGNNLSKKHIQKYIAIDDKHIDEHSPKSLIDDSKHRFRSIGKTIDIELKDNELKYIELITEGDLYSFVQKELPYLYIDRNAVKKPMMHFLFGRIGYFRVHPIYQVYQKHFPDINKLIEQLKTINYKEFNQVLTNIESTIIHDKVCKKFEELKPDAPLLTIHDGIMCLEEDVDYIDKLMRDEFLKYIQVPCQITKE